jgi:hypothetical protein
MVTNQPEAAPPQPQEIVPQPAEAPGGGDDGEE